MKGRKIGHRRLTIHESISVNELRLLTEGIYRERASFSSVLLLSCRQKSYSIFLSSAQFVHRSACYHFVSHFHPSVVGLLHPFLKNPTRFRLSPKLLVIPNMSSYLYIFLRFYLAFDYDLRFCVIFENVLITVFVCVSMYIYSRPNPVCV